MAKPLANQLTTVWCDAVESIASEGKELDLDMVEVMEMKHETMEDSQLVRGLLLDHGTLQGAWIKSGTFLTICFPRLR